MLNFFPSCFLSVLGKKMHSEDEALEFTHYWLFLGNSERNLVSMVSEKETFQCKIALEQLIKEIQNF